MPVMSHAGGLGVAPLVFILGATGLFLAIKTKAVSITRTQIVLAIFLVWLCLTSLWSPYKPDDALTNYTKLAIMVAIFYWSHVLFKYTARHYQRRLQHLFMATSFFAAGILVIDLLSDFGLTFLFNPVSNYNEALFRMIDAEMNLGHSGAVADKSCAARNGVILITSGYCSMAKWGFDASRTFSETFIASDGREIVTVSLHPHNAGIQIWTETGIIGAILASAVICSLFKPVQNYAQSRDHAAAISGVITATIIVSSLTYGAWQFWWWASVFFAIGTLYLFPNSKGSAAQ